MSNGNIDFYNKQYANLEKEINEGLNQVQDTDGMERRNLIIELKAKIDNARNYVIMMQMEAPNISNEEDHENYNDELEKYNQKIAKLEEEVRNAENLAHEQEKSKIKNMSPHNLMKKSLDLQDKQKDSLDNSIVIINNIQTEGNKITSEIGRQKKALEDMQNNMIDMDSELSRANKILKHMINRAATDNCVRVLILLLILAVIGIIIVVCVKPNAIKKQSNGWFNSESNSNITTH